MSNDVGISKLRDLSKLMGTIADSLSGSFGSHEALIPERVGGYIISTVLTPDMGWETALIDKEHAYPVERYDTRADAVVGHAKWKTDAPMLKTVIRLGYGDLIADEVVTLVPDLNN